VGHALDEAPEAIRVASTTLTWKRRGASGRISLAISESSGCDGDRMAAFSRETYPMTCGVALEDP